MPRSDNERRSELSCREQVRPFILLLVAACGHAALAPASSAVIANVVPAGTRPGATCVGVDAPIAQARIDGGALVVCYTAYERGANHDDCWHFDLASARWSFAKRIPHVEPVAPPPQVTATATAARVCTVGGTDCKTVPLSGITLGADDRLSGATNADRSIVAVWAGSGPVHVFDAGGKRLATIQPWPTAMTGDPNTPSFFRAAHVLGSVLEVRIADTPISSAIRLYDARTGTEIDDVFGGAPMVDTIDPVALGRTRYAFLTIDTRAVLVVDVATGKQLAEYPLDIETLEPAMIAPAGDKLAGVVGTTAFVVDGDGKIAIVPAPVCTKPPD